MGKSVLVLGGSYFIGKKIVDILLENGYTVFTFNRGTRSCDSAVTNLIGDRNNAQETKKVLNSHTFDVVIDVSAISRTQVEIVCDALEDKRPKQFLFISSSAVYDVKSNQIPFHETDKLGENEYWTWYGKDKIEAERFLEERFAGTSTQLMILRPPYVYGENNYAQRESFVFDHIQNGKPIIIPNNGDTKLQFIYTTDLAKIVMTLLDAPVAPITIWNVGNKKAVTIREWVTCCAEATGMPANIVEYDYRKDGRNVRDFFPFFDYDNVLEVSKIQALYSDETDFIDGLRSAYAWYCDNKESIEFKENVTTNEVAILQMLR